MTKLDKCPICASDNIDSHSTGGHDLQGGYTEVSIEYVPFCLDCSWHPHYNPNPKSKD